MASGAAVAVAVFAILVVSSMGHGHGHGHHHRHPKTGPLCSECGSLCGANCTAKAATSCHSYCDNPSAARQYCERQVLQACTALYCSYGTCSHDCNMEAQNTCGSVHDTTTDCQACNGGIFQSCYPTCNSDCNNTCVKKGHGC